jgi:predicted RNA-binding protein YlxR (DUF448 family)
MIRFVVGPGDRLCPDVAARLPGRGIWVSATREAVQRAMGRRLFTRSAKRPVVVDADMPAVLDRLLERQCLDIVGMARRAGMLVAGFDKVDGLLRRGPVGVLIEACDGSADGRGKLRALAGSSPVVSLFSATTLAEAIGRDGVVVHAAMGRGKLSERFVAAADRLAGLRELA